VVRSSPNYALNQHGLAMVKYLTGIHMRLANQGTQRIRQALFQPVPRSANTTYDGDVMPMGRMCPSGGKILPAIGLSEVYRNRSSISSN
jgi:hypothetical protein